MAVLFPRFCCLLCASGRTRKYGYSDCNIYVSNYRRLRNGSLGSENSMLLMEMALFRMWICIHGEKNIAQTFLHKARNGWQNRLLYFAWFARFPDLNCKLNDENTMKKAIYHQLVFNISHEFSCQNKQGSFFLKDIFLRTFLLFFRRRTNDMHSIINRIPNLVL